MKEFASKLDKEFSLVVKAHQDLGTKMMEADRGNIFLTDIFTIATLNRSLSLFSAFNTLIKESNYIAAAPLLRVQIDNLIRYNSLWLVGDLNEYVQKVFEGERISKLKDANGKIMKDAYLVKILGKRIPWLSEVYKNASGFVHFSNKHIHSSLSLEDDVNKIIAFNVSVNTSHLPDEVFIELIEAFKTTTKELLSLIYSWIYTKDHKNQ